MRFQWQIIQKTIEWNIFKFVDGLTEAVSTPGEYSWDLLWSSGKSTDFFTNISALS